MSGKQLRKPEEIVRDMEYLRDHLWAKSRGEPASEPWAYCAMHINMVLYKGWHMPPPIGWNYDLTEMPTESGKRFLALWHWGAPDRDVTDIVFAADAPFPGSMPPLLYLTRSGNDVPHYVCKPHAWADLPPIKRPQS